VSGRLSLLYPGSVNVLDAIAPDRLAGKIRALHMGLRLELNLRAPVVIEQLVDELGALDEVTDDELRVRKANALREIERLDREHDRRVRQRNRCPDCGSDIRDGHQPGCPSNIATLPASAGAGDAPAQGELDGMPDPPER
jgi:hypothetical protein